MSWSEFFGIWLKTWFCMAVGLVAWIVGSQTWQWFYYSILTPWRKVDRMKKGKSFTPEQWDAFITELRKVADRQQHRVRTVQLNQANEDRVKMLAKRMEMAQERVSEVFVITPKDTIERRVLEAVILLLDPDVNLHAIDLDVHVVDECQFDCQGKKE